MVQKGGDVLDGASSSEMKFATYRSEGKNKNTVTELKELKQDDGKWVTEFSSGRWPGLTLRGGLPGGNGRFELFEARILSSHTQGWNELYLDILGTASFYNPMKSGGILRIDEDFERIQISSGGIRLKSNRITGNSALTSLRNRRERLLALTEWMAGKNESGAVSGAEKIIFPDQKEFEIYWKPILFPELVSKSKRPAEYKTENAEWRRADSVKWNKTYTGSQFPEGLWEYRNSGAMLRDWEEALPWIYMEYSWDYIIKSFNDTNLNKVK